MIVAGVMSGTSADGIDVALTRISGRGERLRINLLAHEHFAYPKPVRTAVLAAMNATSTSVADLARLNSLLGELYADAVERVRTLHGIAIELVGCHGQTLYHQGAAIPFLGRRIATTWQTGEASILAARLQVPVVSDFRPADMAAGGCGAPLVPLLDVAYYSHPKKLRVLQNLGGIANLTIVPAGATLDQMEGVIAFDTGPGNMVIDACAQQLLGKSYDQNGNVAARGNVLKSALNIALRNPFFRRKPPKTAGREEFGREFVAEFLRWCGPSATTPDVLATATALTAASIGNALHAQLPRQKKSLRLKHNEGEYIVSGGGVSNRTLMSMIAEHVAPLGLSVLSSDQLGLPSQAKEAVAFALLAYRTWHRQPGNVPSATGANRPAVLGKVSYP
ncbi:MAG: anhydro-N-acetylmuramic acid kinase [Acidobacteria bacterium]|nr:anhydro-N-acetylmuramic acid kinase [Acidobacteriota bacterium]MBV9147439.1 anhydro-N-acetylmuramic acid kinase [Acidobacteriota bacterium]MBV9438032.1 anhydro-N-acetylmuramic acid kinase [Acidobacteriota bacterium]